MGSYQFGWYHMSTSKSGFCSFLYTYLSMQVRARWRVIYGFSRSMIPFCLPQFLWNQQIHIQFCKGGRKSSFVSATSQSIFNTPSSRYRIQVLQVHTLCTRYVFNVESIWENVYLRHQIGLFSPIVLSSFYRYHKIFFEFLLQWTWTKSRVFLIPQHKICTEFDKQNSVRDLTHEIPEILEVQQVLDYRDDQVQKKHPDN